MSRRTGQLGSINTIKDGSANPIIRFPSGGVTACSFFQASAPTGWTQDTGNTDAMLRVVSGTGGGTGGSVSATTGLTATDSYTLLIADIPSHNHTGTANSGQAGFGGASNFLSNGAAVTGSTGGNGGHTHNVTFAPKFIDMIIATLD